MFRALVVDDEQLARDRIINLLEQDNDIMVIGECVNGTEAIQQINSNKPDIVFLDIEIPEADAFQVIDRLEPDVHPYIIFVTAYIKYLKKHSPIEEMACLLKPFDTERFQQVVTRVKEMLYKNNNSLNIR